MTDLKCYEVLLNPSAPKLSHIALCEFINSRHVINADKIGLLSYLDCELTFENICEFLIKRTQLSEVYFECFYPRPKRVLFVTNTLKQILDWERQNKFERWYIKSYDQGVKVWNEIKKENKNHIKVKLQEDIDTEVFTQVKRYKPRTCRLNKYSFCSTHSSF